MARILIVEDDRLCALDVKRCLELSGHEVVGIASSGEQLLDLVDRESPALVVMDVNLGGRMDGVTAAQALQHKHQIPVVYLTGYSDQETFERAKLTAPHGFVVKPYDDRTLRATVELALLQSGVEREMAGRGAWLAALVGSLSVGVVATDERGIVRYVNEVASTLIPARQGAPISTVVRVVSAKDRRPLPDPVATALRAGTSIQLPPDAVLTAERGDVPIEGAAAPIRNALGGHFGAVLVLRDVTEERQAEQERLRAQRFESVGLLAGGIAHDFNNMLMTMIAAASLARDAKDPEALTEYLDDITAQCERAASLTRQLLDIARGGLLVRAVTDINSLLRSSARLALRGSATQCALDLDPGVAQVYVDADQIRQLVTNLVLNAREAMNGAGTVTIRARNQTVDNGSLPLEPGSYVRVDVEDTGLGIPREQIDRIFDPFFTTHERGSGLGLTSAFAIARRHSGHLSIRSTEGEGTVASFYLPAGLSRAEPGPQARPEPPTLVGGGRVLLMEDESSLRRLLAECIGELGYDIDTVPKGEDAIACYERALEAGRPYDAVILDLTIENGLGGVDTLRALRALDPDLPAIAMSGYASGPLSVDWRAAGFVEFLPKPFRFGSLARALRTVFSEPRPHTRALIDETKRRHPS